MSREARESNTEARQVPYNASARPSATAGRAMVEDLPAYVFCILFAFLANILRPAVEDYLLQVRLWESRDPCITRLLSVPFELHIPTAPRSLTSSFWMDGEPYIHI